MVIWCRTYGKGPRREPQRKPAATTRDLLYAPSHRQDGTYHGLCDINRGALAETSDSSMGPP